MAIMIREEVRAPPGLASSPGLPSAVTNASHRELKVRMQWLWTAAWLESHSLFISLVRETRGPNR